MNWLAHFYLSEPDPFFRVGNILPDLVSGETLKNLPSDFRPGIVRHYKIDAFTDSHPVVPRSIQRLPPPYRRYAGVLIDVVYDHLLARAWTDYTETPLPDFIGEIYSSFEVCRDAVPPETHSRLEQIRAADLLGSYYELSGVTRAFERISNRLRRPFDLAGSIPFVTLHYDAFKADFAEFFPELISHVEPNPRK